MKERLVKLLFWAIYCVPFVFLAMNEDAVYGTCWFYLVFITSFVVLAYFCTKTKNESAILVGNTLSFISSCIFARIFKSPNWEYYFKPFLPNQLIVFETVVALAVQGLVCVIYKQIRE